SACTAAIVRSGSRWPQRPGGPVKAWQGRPSSSPGSCPPGRAGSPSRIRPGRPRQVSADLDGLPCPALTDPPVSWGQWEQARTIVDVYENGRLEQRLVWWQGEAGGVILCQARSDTHVFLDCRLARDALNRHLWKGEPL